MATSKQDLTYIEKYRRQRKKLRALLENIDEQKNELFRKQKQATC